MLETLQLRNFRQHKNTVLQFVPGINTIVGENNSGKSTLPEGIEFALYGSRALRDSAKGYVTDGEQDGSAVVKMSLAEDIYTVGRNSRNAELRKNGELAGQYKDNVSRDVCTITGVNQTGFRLGHYVRQKELAAFSNMRPGKRHETIEKMLKVHAVDKAIARVKAECDELEITQNVLLRTYKDVDALENELDDLEIVRQSLINDGQTYAAKIDELKSHLADVRALSLARAAALATNAANAKAWVTWETDCAIASKALLDLEKARETLAGLHWEEYDEVKRSVEELRVLEVQHATMSGIKAQLDTPLDEPTAVEKPTEPDDSAYKTVTAAIAAVQKQVNTLKALQGEACCPTCLRQLEDIQAVIDRIETDADLRGMLANAEELKTAFTEAQQKFRTDRKLYEDYCVAKRVYDEGMVKRSKLLLEYVEVSFDATHMATMKQQLDALQTVKEASIRLEEQIVALEASSKEPEKPAVEDLEVGEDVSDELLLLETEADTLNVAYREQASALAHADGRVTELTRTVEQMRTVRTSIDTNAKRLAAYKGEQDAFVLFKRYLTAKIRPMLQEVAEALFHKVTKNRYASYQLGSDYEISFTTHKGYLRKLSTISGSENDLACLCLRLAIATLRSSRLAGSLGFVILDEISGAFDDERTRQTLEGLLELRDVIPQIINITHKPVEMRYADRLFTVTETNNIAKVTYE